MSFCHTLQTLWSTPLNTPQSQDHPMTPRDIKLGGQPQMTPRRYEPSPRSPDQLIPLLGVWGGIIVNLSISDCHNTLCPGVGPQSTQYCISLEIVIPSYWIFTGRSKRCNRCEVSVPLSLILIFHILGWQSCRPQQHFLGVWRGCRMLSFHTNRHILRSGCFK